MVRIVAGSRVPAAPTGVVTQPVKGAAKSQPADSFVASAPRVVATKTPPRLVAAPVQSSDGNAIITDLLAVAKAPPRDFPGLLGQDAFVAWALDHSSTLARVTSLSSAGVTDGKTIADGFDALRSLASALPRSPLRTEAKLLLLLRDCLRNRHDLIAVARLAEGELSGIFAEQLANESDLSLVIGDVSQILKEARDHTAGGIEALLVGAATSAVIDRFLKDVASPLLGAYDKPLKTLVRVIDNPRLNALVVLARELGIPLTDILLKDLPSGALSSSALVQMANGSISDAEMRALFAYLVAKKGATRLDPQHAPVAALLSAYPPLVGADLASVVALTLKSGGVSIEFAPALVASLAPTGSVAKPPAKATEGEAIALRLRSSLATLPDAFSGLLQREDFVTWLVDNPKVLRGLVTLGEQSPSKDGLEDAFAALTATGPFLPADLQALVPLVPALRRLFLDAPAQQAMQPLLAPVGDQLSALYAAIRAPMVVATLKVTQSLQVPLTEVLGDVLSGALQESLLAHLIDQKLTTADVQALFAYLRKKKPHQDIALDLRDASVKAIIKAYSGLASADLSQLTTLRLKASGGVSIAFTDAFKAQVLPARPSITAGDKPGDTWGSQLVFALRRGLDTLPPALKPLLDDEAFVQWLVKDPQLLSQLSDLARGKAVTQGLAALKKVTAKLPKGNVKSMLELVPVLSGVFGELQTADALREYLAPDLPMLEAAHSALVDPMMAAALDITHAQKVQLSEVLKDALAQKGMPADTLAHIVDGALRPQDIQSLFAYLGTKSSDVLLTLSDPSTSRLLRAYAPLAKADLNFVEALRLRDGKLAVLYTPAMVTALSPKTPVHTRGQTAPAAAAGASVFALRRAIDTLPPAFQPLVTDERFVKWLLANPSVLDGVIAGDLDALESFGRQLPAGSQLAPIMALLPVMRQMLGDAHAAEVGEPIIATHRAALMAIADMLKDPNIGAAVAISTEVGISLPKLLQDIVVGAPLTPALVARLREGKPTAADLSVLMAYLGDVSIDKSMPQLHQLLAMYPLPKSANVKAIKRFSLKGDRAHVEFSGRLARVGPLDLRLSEMNGTVKLGKEGLVIDADFGTAFKSVFVDTQFAPFDSNVLNTFFDILLKIILGPLLLLAAMIGEISGVEVHLEDEADGPHFKLEAGWIDWVDESREVLSETRR